MANMAAESTSQFGRETSTPPRKPTTRTVARRKVYGKRRNNASRAMFDPNSPARAPQSSQEPKDPVEAIQVKLAGVSLKEPVLSLEADTLLPSPKRHTPGNKSQHQKAEADTQSRNPLSTRSLNALSTRPPPSPSVQCTRKRNPHNAQLAKRTNHEKMIAETETKPADKEATTENQKCPEPADNEATIENEKNSSSHSITQTRAQERRKARKARRSSVHESKSNDDYVRPILKEALASTSSKGIQPFNTWAAFPTAMFHVTKLAEGSYGEVYKLYLREEWNQPPDTKSQFNKLTALKAYGKGVFKMVPLRAQSGLGARKFTTIDEIVSEVKMLKYLDQIPGFARFREVHVVQGRCPEAFQAAWNHYKKTKDDCLNPNPANKKAYPDTQLWAIIEMDDAGSELEKFAWSSVFQIYDIFWGVAMALARAEECALFEHRDLHLGNVCLRSTRASGSMEPPTELEIVHGQLDSPSGFGISKLETTIIDYSLSRADLKLGDSPNDPAAVIENASSDLDQKQIFDAIGQDEDEVLLRDTYRFMRAIVYTGNPLDTEKTPNIPGIWADYAPRTNLVWLLFLLKSLLKNRKPEPEAVQRASTPVATPKRKALASCSPNKTIARQSPTKSSEDQQSTGSIAKERQTKDLQSRIDQLKKTLEDRLKAVLDLLDLEHGHEDMCCAADLVAYALDSKWLTMEDFI